jgi:glycosyltransferase involved in cell wall biosynthesis
MKTAKMEKASELVSIVMPTFNGEKYIRKAIESCLAQTYSNIELIVIDDCSADNTPKIVNEYLGQDSRLRYSRNERNLKLPGALNKGFELSRGQLLTWTSDDNLYSPEAIQIMVEKLKANPESDIVYSSYSFIDKDDKVVDSFRYKPEFLLFKCVVGACFLYTRKVHDIIGRYDEDKFRMEDYDFWLRAAEKFSFHFIDKSSLYYYRKHSASLTAGIYSNDEVFREYKNNYIATFRSFFNEYMKCDLSEKELRLHAKIFFSELFAITKEGHIEVCNIEDLLRYFRKIRSIDWSKSNFDPHRMEDTIEEVQVTTLKGIVDNMVFLNTRLTKQHPRVAEQFAKPVSWYYKEYEVLPSWYKKVGHIIKAFQGNRTWASLIRSHRKK